MRTSRCSDASAGRAGVRRWRNPPHPHAKALAGNVTPGDAPGYPITLSLPGTYQFSGNVHPTANTIGISIGSDDVTIDLNGFRLHGSTTALFGIAGSAKNVTIKNGTITGFKFDGIFGTGRYWIVDNMRSVENERDGVVCGESAHVRNSTISGNERNGINCAASGLIENNIVKLNAAVGIALISGSTRGNVVEDNGGVGISQSLGAIESNTVVSNDQAGIAGGNIHVLGNYIFGNSGLGIDTTPNLFGFGNNTVMVNNANGLQNTTPVLLHPNGCSPACQGP